MGAMSAIALYFYLYSFPKAIIETYLGGPQPNASEAWSWTLVFSMGALLVLNLFSVLFL